MKSFAILISVALMLFAVITSYENADISSDEHTSSATTSTTAPTEPAGCVDHVFSEATFMTPRKCKNCEATEGKPLCAQCDTWEEIVACAGFEEYSYELQVMDSDEDNHVILYITITDDGLFDTEDSTCSFMLQSFFAMYGISRFSQNKLDVTTPKRFQVDTSIRLNFSDGSLTCMPVNGRYKLGFSTMLSCNEDSPNKYMIENAYNNLFSTVKID